MAEVDLPTKTLSKSRAARRFALNTPSSPPVRRRSGLHALNLPNPRVMDSTGALKLEDIPEKLLVVGGGYIGLELGYVYAALGSKVTVVELTDGLLPGADRELVRPLARRLETMFDKIYLNTKVAKLAEAPGGIKAYLEGEEVAEKEPVFRPRFNCGRPSAQHARDRPGQGRRRAGRERLYQGQRSAANLESEDIRDRRCGR